MPRVRVVLQARVSSTRLPAKVLLPLAGVPLVVLCARRLARRGDEVCVATSTDATDNVLVDLLGTAAIAVTRGALTDVLGRFRDATADLRDDDIVVRATADNPLPDGDLVQALAARLREQGTEYARLGAATDGLPHGVSLEAMTVAALRRADRHAESAYDREHVTPWLARQGPVAGLSHAHLGVPERSMLRCTVDTYDDFDRMQRLFARHPEEAVAAPWWRLVETLAGMPASPRVRMPCRLRGGRAEAVMSLGTVQLGMRYGINNRDGQPDAVTAVHIVRRAIEHGVTLLDTAAAYAEAEERVGAALDGSWRQRVRVVTKLNPITTAAGTDAGCLDAYVDASVYRSLHRLGTGRLDVLMLHRWKDRTVAGGRVWHRLLAHRNAGRIGELGVSLHRPEDALAALHDADIRHIQIPCNLLDQRWLDPALQQARRARADLRVHARSVFLQGLLLGDGRHWPDCDRHGRERLAAIDGLVEVLGRRDRADLCIAYALAQDWIDTIVVGVETLEQLDANLAHVTAPPLSREETDRVRERLRGAPDALLDPSRWHR